jgi:hypothetical protein
MRVLNEPALRVHLMAHPNFDLDSIRVWMADKMKINQLEGCCVQAVLIDGELAGWCGIQPDEDCFELAIVISQRFWEAGLSIFKTLMSWASAFGHEEVLFHLLATRREYKSIAELATKVHQTALSGHTFTTYFFSLQSERLKKYFDKDAT